MSKNVFFSFKYKNVEDFRVNVVRNSNMTKGIAAGYSDHSIWETAKSTSAETLKRLINKKLNNTSVTAVLIGSETYSSRWVRYEIIKSLERGNKLLGIHINSISDKNRQTKSNSPNPFKLSFNPFKSSSYLFNYTPNGPNPFEYITIEIINNIIYVKEWLSGAWGHYKDLENFNNFNLHPHYKYINLPPTKLSYFVNIYDWMLDGGYSNLSKWIES